MDVLAARVKMAWQELIQHLRWLKETEVSQVIRRRIEEFKSFSDRGGDEWFSELCFCILTANSRAKVGIEIQRELGPGGFLFFSPEKLNKKLKEAGHRFPNTRARFIVEARRYGDIKEIISNFGDPPLAREWLVRNIRGLGFKEASHFLRNVGSLDLAILDRHILRISCEHGIIDEIPPSLNRKKYLEIEGILRGLAQQANLPLGELDLYLWYSKTGEVLK